MKYCVLVLSLQYFSKEYIYAYYNFYLLHMKHRNEQTSHSSKIYANSLQIPKKLLQMICCAQGGIASYQSVHHIMIIGLYKFCILTIWQVLDIGMHYRINHVRVKLRKIRSTMN